MELKLGKVRVSPYVEFSESTFPYKNNLIIQDSDSLDSSFNFLPLTNQLVDPTMFKEAKDQEGWVLAMKEEVSVLIENHMWMLVDKPNMANIIRCRWVYHVK